MANYLFKNACLLQTLYQRLPLTGLQLQEAPQRSFYSHLAFRFSYLNVNRKKNIRNSVQRCRQFINSSLAIHMFPAAIPLDNGRLEGYALAPRHMERDIAGGRGEVPVIAAAAAVLTGIAALAAGRLRQGLRLLFQQLVQGFFRAASDQLICPLISSSFSCTIFSDIVCCLLSNVCVVTSFYQSLQAMSSFLLVSICATYLTLSFSVLHRYLMQAIIRAFICSKNRSPIPPGLRFIFYLARWRIRRLRVFFCRVFFFIQNVCSVCRRGERRTF